MIDQLLSTQPNVCFSYAAAFRINLCIFFPVWLPTVKDAKCGYPAACNATETILIHRQLLGKGNFFGKLCDTLKTNNVIPTSFFILGLDFITIFASII